MGKRLKGTARIGIRILIACLASFLLLAPTGIAHAADVPEAGIFQKFFKNSIPQLGEIEKPVREILNTGTKFCDCSYKGKKFTLEGDNDNIYVGSDKPECFTYLSVYTPSISAKKDVYAVMTRCCPMGPCYTTYFFEKDTKGNWKLFDKIAGEAVLYVPGENEALVGVIDSFITNMYYIGKWKNKIFTPTFAFPCFTPGLVYPEAFDKKIKVRVPGKNLQLAPRPEKVDSDNNPAREITLPESREIEVLAERGEYQFVAVKASRGAIDAVAGSVSELTETVLTQAKPSGKISSDDVRKILEECYYELGWMRK
jgi:hypothetical protein